MKPKKRPGSSKNRRFVSLLAAITIPGLVISGLALVYVSQQRQARELKLREDLQTQVNHLRSQTEQAIGDTAREVFKQMASIAGPQTMPGPGTLQGQLKEILLNAPLVKYPFLVDGAGEFLFPLSRRMDLDKLPAANVLEQYLSAPGHRGDRFSRLYRRAEALEFKNRRFAEAARLYLDIPPGLKDKRLGPYVLHAVARCYYKMNKYPQATSYLMDIIRGFGEKAPEDKNFYFRVLYEAARAYRKLEMVNKATDIYLQLYDAVLRHQLSGAPDAFGFYKNEALEFLNRHLDKEQRGRKLSRIMSRDGLGTLSELDISMRWQFFDTSAAAPGHPSEGAAGTGDASRFEIIRELYVPTDEKTLFYRAVKKAEPWKNSGPGFKVLPAPALRSKPVILYGRLGTEEGRTGESREKHLTFGFALSLDVLNRQLLRRLKDNLLPARGLEVYLEQENPAGAVPPLMRVPFESYLAGRFLALYSTENNYLQKEVSKEIWLIYGLILAVIAMLVTGTGLFYKYVTREAELVKLKSDFVDSASHTLKTPLTRIRMMAEKLQLGWFKDESKKEQYLQTIISETDRMAGMISTMLDFSKVESGKKHYQKERFHPAEQVRAIVGAQEAHILGLGFELEIEIHDELPMITADPEALKLVLSNLLQNAVKYSRQEKYIKVKLFNEKSTRDRVVLEVTDRGLGIPEGERESIFQRFYRVPDDQVNASEGSGLGLYLVRHAVAAHGGDIEVSGAPGKGSTFRVFLPAAEKNRGTGKNGEE